MTNIEALQRAVRKKEQEVERLKGNLSEAQTHLGGLRKALEIITKGSTDNSNGSEESLRPGSTIAKVRDILSREGPLHTSEIVKRLGRENTKQNRVSIAGSISAYVRDGRIFEKTAPNTFGVRLDADGAEYPVVDMVPAMDE